MGPYPLSDSTNLLGPTTSLAGNAGTCYTNYGANAYSTPIPMRKCYYDYSYDRDDFRRHSAHGRICMSSGSFKELMFTSFCFIVN